jgi:hypothetical protein
MRGAESRVVSHSTAGVCTHVILSPVVSAIVVQLTMVSIALVLHSLLMPNTVSLASK